MTKLADSGFPRVLVLRSAAARLLKSWVRILLKAWMFVLLYPLRTR